MFERRDNSAYEVPKGHLLPRKATATRIRKHPPRPTQMAPRNPPKHLGSFRRPRWKTNTRRASTGIQEREDGVELVVGKVQVVVVMRDDGCSRRETYASTEPLPLPLTPNFVRGLDMSRAALHQQQPRYCYHLQGVFPVENRIAARNHDPRPSLL